MLHAYGNGSTVAELLDHAVVLERHDNETNVARVPAIAGCHAVGVTSDEAKMELESVFQMIVEEYAEEGRTLPLRQADGCFTRS